MNRSFVYILAVAVCAGCAAKEEVVVEQYKYSARQVPPPPVYSRTTWTVKPERVALPSAESAPLLQPVISFRQPNSNVGEAVQGLARTLGYRAEVPEDLSKREVNLSLTGTAEQVGDAISRQASVKTVLLHEERVVRVEAVAPSASLPSVGQE